MGTSAITFTDNAAATAWNERSAQAAGLCASMTPQDIHAHADYLEFDDCLRAALIDGLSLFTDIPELEILRQQFAQLLSLRILEELVLPTIASDCHPAARLFPIYALISGLDSLRAYHRNLGVDEAVTKDTLSDLLLWINQYKELNGCYGLSQLSWLKAHFTGKLFNLGRLQFKFEEFLEPFIAYRHKQNRKLMLLCEPGLHFRADGQFADADRRLSPTAWISAFEEDEERVRGMLVHPIGVATSSIVTLDKREWECVLRRNDPVLGVHIPAVGPMDFDECGRSIANAMRFFPAIFPENRFRAFTCTSWLLDPQLADHLPTTSNIAQFLTEFHLHPCPGANGNQTIERVFGFDVKPDIETSTRQPKTSLQRTIVRHLENGNCWRGGGALLFPEDFNWGSKVYWRQG